MAKRLHGHLLALCLLLQVGVFGQAAGAAEGVTLVEQGQPRAAIYYSAGHEQAAATLSRYLRQMSGAELAVKEASEKGEVEGAPGAVVLGEVAEQLGAVLQVHTPSKEAFRLRIENGRALLSGESPDAVEWGVYEILERLGCGWYFDLPVGLVVPKQETVALAAADTTQAPSFEARKVWGSNWTRMSEWKRWNRVGGLPADTGHNWSALVPARQHGQAHPEYYPLRDGERKPGRQLCTTNPDVIEIATQTILKQLESGAPSASLSPDDGGGFCECEMCRALDTPGYIEPSSGRICLTDRLMEFFNQVAGPIYERYPDRRLNFYAYSDYTLPPKRVVKASPNLMMWMAPIRYCRIHGMAGGEDCPRRQSLKDVIQDWSKVVQQFGLREYNYDLAECLVPFSKEHVWRSDLPWLHKIGCRAVNLESIHSISIMAPTIWLSARLAWDVNADADALMTRFWTGLFGEQAGPIMKQYWDRIDAAWAKCPSHAGSFFCVPAVYADDLLQACRADLNRAKGLLDDETRRERWDIFEAGLRNAELYMEMLRAFNAGQFQQAADLHSQLEKHLEAMLQKGWVNIYTVQYLQRFVSRAIRQAAARSRDGNEVAARLPDVWRFRYDEDDVGEAQGFFGAQEIGEWRDVKTFSATLEEQDVPENLTLMWYRNTFTVPSQFKGRTVGLWFGGADRDVKVWINGQPVFAEIKDPATGEFQKSLVAKSGPPVQFNVTGAVRFDEINALTVKVDHRNLTDLALGGIVKPVFVYAAAPGQGLVRDPEAESLKKEAASKGTGTGRKAKDKKQGEKRPKSK